MSGFSLGRKSKIQIIITKKKNRSRLKLVTVWVVIIYAVVYYKSALRTIDVDRSQLQEELKEYIGLDCVIPYLETFSNISIEPYKPRPDINCDGQNWVACYRSQCKVQEIVMESLTNIVCTYNDIIHKSDSEYVFGPPTLVKSDDVYTLNISDHVKVACNGTYKDGEDLKWNYFCAGIRDSVKPKHSPPGREKSLNVLILIFDSTSRISFMRNLPKSYEYLVKVLKGTVLKGYNIVGDGTSAALFPILTGKTEFEMPNVRKDSNNNRTLDCLPFIFYNLKEDGYRTAYLEDSPWIGTFQLKYNGFRHQPADHYLRSFFMEEALNNTRVWANGDNKYCVGDIPQYQLMLDLTNQFLLLDGKRFCLTFIADLSHDQHTMLSVADKALLKFLQTLAARQQLRDTLVLVMGDHGPRFGNIRKSLNGRLMERQPFMSVILPDELKRRRPDAQAALEVNADRWTTPFDIHTTILDALDLPQHINQYKVPGAHIPRGMSFLKVIPKNRTCWNAGIEPHWCTCLAWRDVPKSDPLYIKAANALMRYINLLTHTVRDKCAIRNITEIDWVKRHQVNEQMMAMKDRLVRINKENYQVRMVASPGKAVYEASMTYIHGNKRFIVETKHVSRINAYGKEPSCIRDKRPHLNMFCYCIENKLA